jgi:chromosome segregation ATPase
MIPFACIGGKPPTAASHPPMTKGDYLLQGREAELSKLRLAKQMLREQLEEEVAAHAQTKRAKDELTQVQDTREERSLSNENSLMSDKIRLTQDKIRLMEQVSNVEDELKAKSVALQTLDAKRKRQVTTAQHLSGSYRKERDTFKDESDALEVQVDELKDNLDELKRDFDTLKDELVGATARIGKLLGERTKVSAALQESKRRIKEQSTVAQRNITVLQ